jgi:2-oxoglutarate ferredoxin oxidoreductase subunit gamma
MKTEKIICAGFGGQGILSMGQLLAYAGMDEGKHVTWLPSYGPEMRGGTANCHIILSRNPIDSPIISQATTIVVMNLPSLRKFEPYLEPGGLLLINSTLVKEESGRADVRTIRVPATQSAIDLKKDEVANMVMLGALLALTGVVEVDSVIASFCKAFEHTTPELSKLDVQAMKLGKSLIEQKVGS